METPALETVNDHILAAAKLVAVEMFAGADISQPLTLSGDEVFDIINDMLKDNYDYTIGKFTHYFSVRKTMREVAGEYGVELILT